MIIPKLKKNNVSIFFRFNETLYTGIKINKSRDPMCNVSCISYYYQETFYLLMHNTTTSGGKGLYTLERVRILIKIKQRWLCIVHVLYIYQNVRFPTYNCNGSGLFIFFATLGYIVSFTIMRRNERKIEIMREQEKFIV